jgi:TatD-related deoxyribonuclease
MEYEGPVLDDHCHLDPVGGRGAEAAEAFAEAGGTHLMVLNKPSWHLVEPGTDEAIFREGFELTVEVVAAASERLPGRAWPVLGVHPALISTLIDEEGYAPAEAAAVMQTGLDVAAEFVADGAAVALKSGRPHYEVDEQTWAASNDVMCHAFDLAADLDCAVQLHAEGSEDMRTVAEWATERGLPAEKVLKHYSGGRLAGPTKSVIAHREEIEVAVEEGDPFMLETDFLDDPERPGAVLGPKTVPRRTRWMAEQGWEDALECAHVETPAAVYDVDTRATLVA